MSINTEVAYMALRGRPINIKKGYEYQVLNGGNIYKLKPFYGIHFDMCRFGIYSFDEIDRLTKKFISELSKFSDDKLLGMSSEKIMKYYDSCFSGVGVSASTNLEDAMYDIISNCTITPVVRLFNHFFKYNASLVKNYAYYYPEAYSCIFNENILSKNEQYVLGLIRVFDREFALSEHLMENNDSLFDNLKVTYKKIILNSNLSEDLTLRNLGMLLHKRVIHLGSIDFVKK